MLHRIGIRSNPAPCNNTGFTRALPASQGIDFTNAEATADFSDECITVPVQFRAKSFSYRGIQNYAGIIR